MLRALTITVAGLATAVLLKRVADAVRALQAGAAPQPARDLRPATRLRQDPVTGIYHPEP
jgi:hypothetical protein